MQGLIKANKTLSTVTGQTFASRFEKKRFSTLASNKLLKNISLDISLQVGLYGRRVFFHKSCRRTHHFILNPDCQLLPIIPKVHKKKTIQYFSLNMTQIF